MRFFSNLEESSVRGGFSPHRRLCSIFSQGHAERPAALCVTRPRMEPPSPAALTQPGTRLPEGGPAGTLASWSFLFHALLTAANPWASCTRG